MWNPAVWSPGPDDQTAEAGKVGDDQSAEAGKVEGIVGEEKAGKEDMPASIEGVGFAYTAGKVNKTRTYWAMFHKARSTCIRADLLLASLMLLSAESLPPKG